MALSATLGFPAVDVKLDQSAREQALSSGPLQQVESLSESSYGLP